MKCSLLFVSLFSYVFCYSQSTIRPFQLDKSVLSGVGLEKIKLKDEPEKNFHQKMLYRGKDISVFVVSTETWNNDFNDFWFDEFIYMFHGEAIIKPKNGSSQIFYSGDYFFAPKGYTGEWEIKAGNHLHYELSVITTHRADSTKISSQMSHQLFDRSKLSGAHIDLTTTSTHSEVLRKGVELTVTLHAQMPKQTKIDTPSKEMLVQVLSGQITLMDTNNVDQVFHTGDFFIIPSGFLGSWKSEGHGIVKYITVEKSV